MQYAMEAEDKAKRFGFRNGLYTMSSKLTTPDVKKIRFMLSDFLPKQQLEKAGGGFDLLCLMATRSELLSPDNLSLLQEVLQEVGKRDSMEAAFSRPGTNYFLPMFSSAMKPHSSQLQQERPRLLQIKKLYSNMCDSLSAQNVHDLSLFFADVGEALKYHEVQHVKSAEDLFSTLEEGHLIGAGQLLPLQHTLVLIGRLDLASTIDAFQSEMTSTPNVLSGELLPEGNSLSSIGGSLPETDGALSTRELVLKLEEREKRLEEQKRELEVMNSTGEQVHLLRSDLKVKIGEVQMLSDQIRKLQDLLWHKNDVPVYNMFQKPHGLAIIFINERFVPTANSRTFLQERMGALKDEEYFYKTFQFLHYDPHVYKNRTAAEMKEVMVALSQLDHSMYDSLVCCVSSHGNQIGVYGSDSVLIHRSHFVDYTKSCSTLTGKPKLFFFQACRIKAVEADAPGEEPVTSYLHKDSDILVANASTEGAEAYTSPESGSWFASAVLQKLTHPELVYSRTLQQLLEEVTALVCDSKGVLPGGEQVNQCVQVTTSMRKGVKFFLNQDM